MPDGILNTIKVNVGVDPDDQDFDDQLISAINSAFATAHQLGLGPKHVFVITGTEETWDDYMPSSYSRSMLIDLITNLVKKKFDPPTSSSLMQAIDDEIKELEYRIIMQLEVGDPLDDDE